MAIRFILNTPFVNHLLYPSGAGVNPLLVDTSLAGGGIFFFADSSHTTKRAVYQDPNHTILYTNPVILSDIGTVLPIYMEPNVPYFVIITGPALDLINPLYSMDDLVYPSGGTPVGKTHYTLNILPVFGWESGTLDNIYNNAEDPIPIGSGTTALSLGTIYEFGGPALSFKDFSVKNALNNSGITGNPQNSLTLTSTANAASGTADKRIRWRIGSYNSYQGKQLSFAMHGRKISGGFTTLDVILIRTKNGVDFDFIAAGTIKISDTVLTQDSIVFTVPTLTSIGYARSDSLSLVIKLPLNSDFNLELTATWCQESPDGTLDIHEVPPGYQAANMILSSPNLYDFKFYGEQVGGNAMLWSEYGMAALDQTTTMLLSYDGGKATHYANYMYSDDTETRLQGTQSDDCESRKYIEQSEKHGIRSKHTFAVIPQVNGNEWEFQADLPTPHVSTWASSDPITVEMAVVQVEFPYGVIASLYPEEKTSTSWNIVRLTWIGSGATQAGIWNPILTPNIVGVFTSFDGGLTPVVANYFGSANWIENIGGAPGPTGNGVFTVGATGYSIPAAGGQPASYLFNTDSFLTNRVNRNGTGGGSRGGDSIAHIGNRKDNQHLQSFTYGMDHNTPTQTLQYNMNYLGWMNSGQVLPEQTGGTINGIYTNVLFYNLGLPNIAPPPAPGGHLIQVDINGDMSLKDIAIRTRDTINIRRRGKFVVHSLPTNGTYLTIDNGIQPLELIYHDVAQARPAKTPGVYGRYIEFSATTSLDSLAFLTADAINGVSYGSADPRYFGFDIPREMIALIKT